MVNQYAYSGVTVKKEKLIALLESDLKEITDRITELEVKEADGTITTSETNPNQKELDELNELYILKDYYSIELYKGVLDKISDGLFSSVNELQTYLKTELSKADRITDDSNFDQSAVVEVKKLSQQQFTDITTLDRILYEVEKLIEG